MSYQFSRIPSQSIIFVGWSYEELRILEKSAFFTNLANPCHSIPWFNYPIDSHLDKINISPSSLSNIESGLPSYNDDIFPEFASRISSDQFEMLILQLARTPFNSYSFYDQIRACRNSISMSIVIIQNLHIISGSLFLFRDWPHLFTDYALSIAATCLNCKTVVFSTLKGYAKDLTASASDPVFYSFHDLSSSTIIKMERQSKAASDLVFSKLQTLVSPNPKSLSSNDNIEQPSPHMAYPKRPELLTNLLQDKHNSLNAIYHGCFQRNLSFLRDLRAHYNEISSLDIYFFSSPKPFIYFPLPKQPEATTQPYCGSRWDPLYWIRRLYSQLNGQYSIVIKEHPDTFRYSLCSNQHFICPSFFGRSVHNYSILRSVFPNIYFADINLPQLELINHPSCVAVFAMNGGATYEAMRLYKYSILPNFHWMNKLPLTMSIDNLSLSTLAHATHVDNHSLLELQSSLHEFSSFYWRSFFHQTCPSSTDTYFAKDLSHLTHS